MKNPDLDDAYALNGPEQVKSLYRHWAHSYDAGFSDSQGYRLPQEVAHAFAAAGGKGPVLDVGAGTGLVAEYLNRKGIGPLDAVDLSGDMLSVARMKGLYRDLIEADVTQPLPAGPLYDGIVSAGTFTLGHVGPEGIVALFDAANPQALFVISVNAKHFESAGFAAMLDAQKARIKGLTLKDVRIYDDRAEKAHRNDLARLLIFRTV